MNKNVDFFFNKNGKWQEEYKKLRAITLSCGLPEELKWGKPCYTFQDKNIVIIQGFKEYCALMFFKGSLLKDTNGILNKVGQAQGMRQIRFTSVHEISTQKAIIKEYIYEAIEVEKAGLKVKLKKTSDFEIPEEFQIKLDENPDLKAAFKALTPGRQRAYIFYFSQAKQSKTRIARVEKYIRHILDGKGLND